MVVDMPNTPTSSTVQVLNLMKSAIESSDYTVPQLAGELGMSQRTLERRLKGVTPFDADELLATARILAVPLSSLLPSE